MFSQVFSFEGLLAPTPSVLVRLGSRAGLEVPGFTWGANSVILPEEFGVVVGVSCAAIAVPEPCSGGAGDVPDRPFTGLQYKIKKFA